MRDAVGVRWTPLPRTSTALRPEKYPIFQSRDALRRWATAPRPHTRRIHAGRAWPRPAESRHSPPTLASSSSSPAHWVRCRGAAAWSGGTAAPRQWQSFDSAGKCLPIPQARCDDRDTLHVPGTATASLGPLAPKPARPARCQQRVTVGPPPATAIRKGAMPDESASSMKHFVPEIRSCGCALVGALWVQPKQRAV